MTDNEAIAKMKAPKDSRNTWPLGVAPSAKFGGILQICITRMCDMACSHCTQGSNLVGPYHSMTLDQFETAVKSLVEPTMYPGVVGIFGGNPTLHKQFDEICEILRKYIPFERRGLWSNRLFGHGLTCKKTFNPDVSNLNVHQNKEAYYEMLRDWPLCEPKGLEEDSRHSPTLVAMQDMEDMTDGERWELISNCDVNQRWSALIGVFRGELRAWFCELAGAQAMLHEAEPDYPDTGHRVLPGWWNHDITHFDSQIRYHCFACGHPLRAKGDYANTGTVEQVSKTHVSIYNLKRPKGKRIDIITKKSQLGEQVSAATQYLSTEAK